MKKCKECGRDEWGFLSSLNEDGYCPTCAIKHNQDKIKRLQEQLNEANKTIKKAQELCPDKNVMLMCNPARPSFGMMTNDVLTKYIEKWGIK